MLKKYKYVMPIFASALAMFNFGFAQDVELTQDVEQTQNVEQIKTQDVEQTQE